MGATHGLETRLASAGASGGVRIRRDDRLASWLARRWTATKLTSPPKFAAVARLRHRSATETEARGSNGHRRY